MGLQTYLSGSATNAPVTVNWDNLTVNGDAAPPVNQKPVASFTSSSSGLALSVDGSGSSDPDGSVASYAWDFGDGGSATGVTASHTYAAAGTYQVSLTVTDNGGATDVATQSVSVTAPGGNTAAASDSFGRTVSNGWGSADVGGQWTVDGPAGRYSVGGGVGSMQVPGAGYTDRAMLGSVSQGDTNMLVSVSTDKAPTGSGIYLPLIAHSTSQGEYRGKVRLRADGSVHLVLSRVVSGSGESLFGEWNVSGLSYSVGDVLRVRFQVTTSGGQTKLALTAWKAGTSEPASPQATATDSTSALQGPGAVGLQTYLSGSATNAPVTVNWDNLTVNGTGV